MTQRGSGFREDGPDFDVEPNCFAVGTVFNFFHLSGLS